MTLLLTGCCAVLVALFLSTAVLLSDAAQLGNIAMFCKNCTDHDPIDHLEVADAMLAGMMTAAGNATDHSSASASAASPSAPQVVWFRNISAYPSKPVLIGAATMFLARNNVAQVYFEGEGRHPGFLKLADKSPQVFFHVLFCGMLTKDMYRPNVHYMHHQAERIGYFAGAAVAAVSSSHVVAFYTPPTYTTHAIEVLSEVSVCELAMIGGFAKGARDSGGNETTILWIQGIDDLRTLVPRKGIDAVVAYRFDSFVPVAEEFGHVLTVAHGVDPSPYLDNSTNVSKRILSTLGSDMLETFRSRAARVAASQMIGGDLAVGNLSLITFPRNLLVPCADPCDVLDAAAVGRLIAARESTYLHLQSVTFPVDVDEKSGMAGLAMLTSQKLQDVTRHVRGATNSFPFATCSATLLPLGQQGQIVACISFSSPTPTEADGQIVLGFLSFATGLLQLVEQIGSQPPVRVGASFSLGVGPNGRQRVYLAMGANATTGALLDDVWYLELLPVMAVLTLVVGDWQQVPRTGLWPAARRDHTITGFSSSQSVYLFGGSTTDRNMWELSIATGTWSVLVVLNWPRIRHTAAFIDRPLSSEFKEKGGDYVDGTMWVAYGGGALDTAATALTLVAINGTTTGDVAIAEVEPYHSHFGPTSDLMVWPLPLFNALFIVEKLNPATDYYRSNRRYIGHVFHGGDNHIEAELHFGPLLGSVTPPDNSSSSGSSSAGSQAANSVGATIAIGAAESYHYGSDDESEFPVLLITAGGGSSSTGAVEYNLYHPQKVWGCSPLRNERLSSSFLKCEHCDEGWTANQVTHKCEKCKVTADSDHHEDHQMFCPRIHYPSMSVATVGFVGFLVAFITVNFFFGVRQYFQYRRMYVQDQLAVGLAESVAVLDFDKLDYLTKLDNPTRLQAGFLVILDILEMYIRFMPAWVNSANRQKCDGRPDRRRAPSIGGGRSRSQLSAESSKGSESKLKINVRRTQKPTTNRDGDSGDDSDKDEEVETFAHIDIGILPICAFDAEVTLLAIWLPAMDASFSANEFHSGTGWRIGGTNWHVVSQDSSNSGEKRHSGHFSHSEAAVADSNSNDARSARIDGGYASVKYDELFSDFYTLCNFHAESYHGLLNFWAGDRALFTFNGLRTRHRPQQAAASTALRIDHFRRKMVTVNMAIVTSRSVVGVAGSKSRGEHSFVVTPSVSLAFQLCNSATQLQRKNPDTCVITRRIMFLYRPMRAALFEKFSMAVVGMLDVGQGAPQMIAHITGKRQDRKTRARSYDERNLALELIFDGDVASARAILEKVERFGKKVSPLNEQDMEFVRHVLHAGCLSIVGPLPKW